MLKTEGVTIRFGGLVAVNQVSIHVRKNQITGLIGPNGAGKTTLFNCVSGVYKPTEGHVIFNGERIDGLMPHKINEKGMARTYQVINLFNKMSVVENIMVGMHSRLKTNFWGDLFHTRSEQQEEKFVREEAEKWMEFVGLQDQANDPAGSLSYGKQRLLEIVRGLASNPQLILLDEPAAGMNTKEKEEFDQLLQRILGLGVTILMIEHDMKLVMGVCDYIYCLDHGSLLCEGLPDYVQNHPDVITAYLGGDE